MSYVTRVNRDVRGMVRAYSSCATDTPELAQIVLVSLRGIYTLLAFLTLVAAYWLLWLSRIRRVA